MSTLELLVAERIADQVPDLVGRIEDIAELAALIAAGALPQHDLFAFVVPLGFDDRGGESATGFHTQTIEDAVGVVLGVKARGDAKAKKAMPPITQLRNQVRDAVAGWAPTDSVDVFFVRRGRLLSADNGLVLYQLDFSLTDQLRIT